MSLTPGHRLLPCPATVRGQGLHLGYDTKNKNRICYPSRAGIVVRSLTDPKDSDIYTGYRGTDNTTVAKFSASGYYIACGSKDGRLKIIADKRNEEGDFIEKYEYEVLSGEIKDIGWDADNQRIAVVGNGKETFTRALLVNSGATVGDLGGHSNPVLSVAIKPTRPYRCVTGSEDFKSNFYHGPPFKLQLSNAEHTNYVNCVRFSSKGDHFCTVGSDKMGCIYDGKTGALAGQFAEEGKHKGSVYVCSWSPDDKFILTTSADKTAKIWAVGEDCNATLAETLSFLDPKDIKNMVVGGQWCESGIVTLSLRGDLHFCEPGKPEPSLTWKGHQDPVYSIQNNAATNKLVACDGGGRA